MEIPEKIKNELKKPLGKFVELDRIKEIAKNKRIITVGDVCTLNLISIGVVPHLAVFDHVYMRHNLEPDSVEILEKKFSNPKRYDNPAGTLSEKIIEDAKMLLEDGGAVLIKGEEDLTALAFILVAKESDLILYGQPNEGMIMVEPKEEVKKKIKKWLATAALSHKVKGNESR